MRTRSESFYVDRSGDGRGLSSDAWAIWLTRAVFEFRIPSSSLCTMFKTASFLSQQAVFRPAKRKEEVDVAVHKILLMAKEFHLMDLGL